MMTESQEQALTSSGDCFLHYHSTDRQVRYEDLAGYQDLARVKSVPSSGVISDEVDFVLADTSVQDLTLTLPSSRRGRELEIVKNSPQNTLILRVQGTDKVLDETEIRVYNYGTALKFKAIPGGWIII